jgi:phosphotriesterase-related protein
MSAKKIVSVTGPVRQDALGYILPHEHLFTDLRGPHVAGYASAEPAAVLEVVLPYLKAAEKAGVTALVECSTLGVGRNIQVLAHLAAHTAIRIIAPTGVYREAFIPEEMKTVSAEWLTENWVSELEEGIEDSSCRAGFIKLAVSDDGPTPLEIRNLKAAGRASQATGAAVACHTIGGQNARIVMDTLEAAGMDLGRFIWVHAQTEPDQAIHLEAAARGVYLEIDSVGGDWQPESELLEYTINLISNGYSGQVLLSHDAGWFQPGSPSGEPEAGYRGYTALSERFLPALKAAGVPAEMLRVITQVNPFRAYAF